MRGLAWGLAALLAGCSQAATPPPPSEKPALAVLTSLPIFFGEQFALDAPPSPLRDALERDYRVDVVDGPEGLPAKGLLLAIQPQALTAERLVALDRWVRDGGRLVLLADPKLEWESERPLGDRFRPPFAYPDTGLLDHWGVRIAEDEARPVRVGKADEAAEISSPGQVIATGPSCRAVDAFVATCRVGSGRVLIIPDADFAMRGRPADLSAVSALLAAARAD